LGETPLRRLYEQVVQPVATRATKGAWYRTWRLVSLDGSSLDVADTAENGIAFGVFAHPPVRMSDGQDGCTPPARFCGSGLRRCVDLRTGS